jgi:parallel beta-helix repeat protein
VSSFALASLALAPTVSAASTLQVSQASGSADSGNCISTPCLTIGYAISKAVSGDTITVAAGTYTEQLRINKSLTISGPNAGVNPNTGTRVSEAIIQAPGSLTPDSTGDKSIVDVNGATTTVTLNGISIQGLSSSIASAIHIHDQAAATITNDIIQGSGPVVASNNGIGIDVGESFVNGGGAPGTGTIQNNKILGFQKAAVFAGGNDTSATVSSNVITGGGVVAGPIQDGISFQDNAGGSITHNAISAIASNEDLTDANHYSDNATAIFLYDSADGVSISNNQISNSQVGIMVQAVAGLTISDNQINSPAGFQQKGIWLLGRNSTGTCATDYAGGAVGCGVSATLTNNTLTGSGAGLGLVVGKTPDITFTPYPTSVAANNETISGWDQGVWVGPSSVANTVSISGSSITGNSTKAINNTDGATTVTATNNWWGSVNPTFASIISGTVVYNLWCTDSSCTTYSNNTDLTSLSLSSGTLNPAFDPSTTAYSASVDNSVTSVTVTKSTNPGANAVVTGGSNLSVSNNTITITVTSADGLATKTYTITVTRSAAPEPASPTAASPQASAQTYTVVSGDTLSGIGTTFGVDWHLIASLNGINAPYTIYPGQVLRLPGGSVVAALASGGPAAQGTGSGPATKVLGESSNAQVGTALSATAKKLPRPTAAASAAAQKVGHLKWYWWVAIAAAGVVIAGASYYSGYRRANTLKGKKD